MKKITIIVLAVAGVALASCNKDRTCTCTFTSSIPGSASSTISTREVTIKNVSKGDAIDGQCSSGSFQFTAPTQGTKNETKCVLN